MCAHIYIYMCVCVCVCLFIYVKNHVSCLHIDPYRGTVPALTHHYPDPKYASSRHLTSGSLAASGQVACPVRKTWPTVSPSVGQSKLAKMSSRSEDYKSQSRHSYHVLKSLAALSASTRSSKRFFGSLVTLISCGHPFELRWQTTLNPVPPYPKPLPHAGGYLIATSASCPTTEETSRSITSCCPQVFCVDCFESRSCSANLRRRIGPHFSDTNKRTFLEGN